MTQIHEDRNRMDRDIQLTEPNPYYHSGDQGQDNKMRWRSLWELEEWAYDQGFDCGIDELWKMAPRDFREEIGMMFLQEGAEAAEAMMNEEIEHTIETIRSEHLDSYVDGQLRMYAGYDVAENGDTLEEGDYNEWEHLRMMFDAGLQDKLRDNERYSSIRH